MSLYVVIGLPGSGKSTFGARLSRMYQKKKIPFFCNYEVRGSYLFNVSDLGKFDISNCAICIDEAGIDLNNRSYKSMPKEQIEFYKKYRHYGVKDVWVFSQAFDFDITLRRLADKMFIIKKPLLLPWFSYMLPVKPKWDTDVEGQPTIKWSIIKLPTKITFRPRYYKYFDSYEHKQLPYKEFPYMEHPARKYPPIKEILPQLKEDLRDKLAELKARRIANKRIDKGLSAEEKYLEDLNKALH